VVHKHPFKKVGVVTHLHAQKAYKIHNLMSTANSHEINEIFMKAQLSFPVNCPFRRIVVQIPHFSGGRVFPKLVLDFDSI